MAGKFGVSKDRAGKSRFRPKARSHSPCHSTRFRSIRCPELIAVRNAFQQPTTHVRAARRSGSAPSPVVRRGSDRHDAGRVGTKDRDCARHPARPDFAAGTRPVRRPTLPSGATIRSQPPRRP
jgi:hypothetical protein